MAQRQLEERMDCTKKEASVIKEILMNLSESVKRLPVEVRENNRATTQTVNGKNIDSSMVTPSSSEKRKNAEVKMIPRN